MGRNQINKSRLTHGGLLIVEDDQKKRRKGHGLPRPQEKNHIVGRDDKNKS